MIKRIRRENLGGSNLGWLKSEFHFSFAEYYNPQNINYGVLRVLNNDVIMPGGGFGMHPHRDMEIITYIISGELTHEDSMGNKHTLTRGDLQYMTAGTGLFHSEYNHGTDPLHLLQIWIFPNAKDLEPNYAEKKLDYAKCENNFLHLISDVKGTGIAKVHQDVNMYVIDTMEKVEFKVNKNRQVYIVLIAGDCTFNNHDLSTGDALECDDSTIEMIPTTPSHIFIIEMSKGDWSTYD